jgi:hypothetical protein
MEPYDYLKYSIANYGKTPASVESAAFGISVGTAPEPPVTVSVWHSLLEPPILMPNERRDDTAYVPETISMSQFSDEHIPPSDSCMEPDLTDGEDFFFWARIKYHGPCSARVLT